MDGIIRESRIYRIDRQKQDGTWQEWHVATCNGQECEFTSYEAAHRWLLHRAESAALVAALNEENCK